jgi:outer membrane protein assembly factor BamB
MTQAKRAIIASGVLLALTVLSPTLAPAGNTGAQDGWRQTHSEDLTSSKMFVGDRATNTVDVFDRNGSKVAALTVAGLDFPFGIDVDDGNIYVVSQKSDEVYAYLRKSHRNDPPGTVPALELLVPKQAGGLKAPFYTTVADGMLYVSSYGTDEVLRYDAETGEFIDVAVTAGEGGLSGPRGLDFDSTGRLYVASSGRDGVIGDEVIVYNRRGKAIRHIASGIPVPCGVSISKYDEVCVGSSGGSGVHCYDTKGNEIYSDPIGKVCGLDFGPRGNLYTTRPDMRTVTVHTLRPGTMGEWFADTDLPSGLSWGE